MSDTPRVAALIERNRSACNLTKYCDMIGLANDLDMKCQRLREALEAMREAYFVNDASLNAAQADAEDKARAALQVTP